MKCLSLASFLSGSILILGSSLLQNSCSAAFVGSSFTAHSSSNTGTSRSSEQLSTNKGLPPSMTPGRPTQPTLTTTPPPPAQPLPSSPLTVQRYSNDQTADIKASSSSSSSPVIAAVAEQRRQEWIDRSVNYYTKVMREERRRRLGQAPAAPPPREYQQHFNTLAKKHYFALRKIKDGKPQHAERIYRRIIGELQQDTDCDNAKLAVTTLLLALLLQRVGSPKQTRSVFLNFFRVAMLGHGESSSTTKDVFDFKNSGDEGHEQCACSAKVMQAYALFEMKQGNSMKSLQLVQKAVQLDPSLEPVLNWKQFRDAAKNYAMYLS